MLCVDHVVHDYPLTANATANETAHGRLYINTGAEFSGADYLAVNNQTNWGMKMTKIYRGSRTSPNAL